MKKEDLRASLDRIRPDDAARSRMLHNIMNHSYEKKGFFMRPLTLKKAIPALALAVVLTGGLLAYNMLYGDSAENPPRYVSADDGREDAIAPLLNQFQLDDMHYILLTDDLRADFGFPAAISDGDIGEKIADIKSGPDKSLIGCEVYRYNPAGGDAVVAVKKDGGYQLYHFFTFESYNNNQDEDAARYLALHGIDSADDIAKIRFIGYSEQAKLRGVPDIVGEITDRDEIGRFYDFYSVLKDSSDRYFDKLFDFSGLGSAEQGAEIDRTKPDTVVPDLTAPDAIAPDEVPPYTVDPVAPDRPDYAEDMPMNVVPDRSYSADTPISNEAPSASGGSAGMMDMGNTTSGMVAPSQGLAGDALADFVTIRIYNQNGVYYDSIYYINIGFISRFEVGEDFADFLSGYINR